jgi:hypothetical protein
MSRAATRETMRIEDIAYSLRGILAPSPAEFRDASSIIMVEEAANDIIHFKTSGYLLVKTSLFPGPDRNLVLSLNCHMDGQPAEGTMGTQLSCTGPRTYCRLSPSRLVYTQCCLTFKEQELDVEMKPSPEKLANMARRRAAQILVRYRFNPSHFRLCELVPWNHTVNQHSAQGQVVCDLCAHWRRACCGSGCMEPQAYTAGRQHLLMSHQQYRCRWNAVWSSRQPAQWRRRHRHTVRCRAYRERRLSDLF